jgi:hypothetical protein
VLGDLATLSPGTRADARAIVAWGAQIIGPATEALKQRFYVPMRASGRNDTEAYDPIPRRTAL